MKKLIQSMLIAGALTAASGIAFAQMDGGMMGHDAMHGNSAKMEKMHTEHLAKLKGILKITPAQEPAWNAFTASMKPPANMGKRPDRAELDKLTTPERMEKMRAMHKERMAMMDAAMEKKVEATRTFYASLTPEQQKTFDVEHAKMSKHAMERKHMKHGKKGDMAAADSTAAK